MTGYAGSVPPRERDALMGFLRVLKTMIGTRGGERVGREVDRTSDRRSEALTDLRRRAERLEQMRNVQQRREDEGAK